MCRGVCPPGLERVGYMHMIGNSRIPQMVRQKMAKENLEDPESPEMTVRKDLHIAEILYGQN